MEQFRIGLIGLGVMGRIHLEKEQNLDEARIVAVADVARAAVDDVSARYGLPGYYAPEELLDSGEVDGVLIATPHPFHAPLAIEAAARGLHVLCEKPIAVSISEADRMLAAARERGVALGLMFQLRTDPVFRTAREIVASGVLGTIYRTTLIATNWYRTQSYYDSGAWRGTWKGEGGGVIMNQAPHSLDLFIWLGGMPSHVEARAWTRGHRIEVEDTVSATLEYPNGATGYFYTTTAELPGESRFEVVGDRGKLVVLDRSVRLFRMQQSLREHIETGDQPAGPVFAAREDVPVEPAPSGHAEVVRRFARAVRAGEPLVATGQDGLNALELANALLLSGYRRRPVDLPLDRAEYDAFLAEKRAST